MFLAGLKFEAHLLTTLQPVFIHECDAWKNTFGSPIIAMDGPKFFSQILPDDTLT